MWFEENLLIRYWESRCGRYTLPDGRRIVSASRNWPLSRYPDILENKLSDGSRAPAEIEWTTSSFWRHGHDLRILEQRGGFLVVVHQDAAFPLPQLSIDVEDVGKWLSTNATRVAGETFARVVAAESRPSSPVVFLYYAGGPTGTKNLEIALRERRWGFPRQQRNRSLPAASLVRPGDLFVVLSRFRGVARIPVERFSGVFERVLVLITSSKLEEREESPWSDRQYPYQFTFRVPALIDAPSLTVAKRKPGRALRGCLHRVLNNQSMVQIDPTLFVELQSLIGR